MKGKIYAISLILLFFAGAVGVFIASFFFDWGLLTAIIGFLLSMFVVPTVHELGHLTMAKLNKFKVVYCKFFCFKFYEKKGRMRFGLASPFGGDETRFVPKSGENMKKRVLPVVAGGLVFSGAFALSLLVLATVLQCFGLPVFLLWGVLPYAVYLFLLNALPVEYASGKTDALVHREIRKEKTEGKAFLSAMEIQGRLYEGEGYAEIPTLLYDTFGLREDDPLFAVLWELKYRYYLEKAEMDNAADALNRLIASSDYLTAEGWTTVRIELAYMFLLQGDASSLKELLATDEKLLRSDDCRVKRLLATYARSCGDKDRAKLLVDQARELLKKEKIKGVKNHELMLLDRLGV